MLYVVDAELIFNLVFKNNQSYWLHAITDISSDNRRFYVSFFFGIRGMSLMNFMFARYI